jgi:5-formyltetrahydrofolate cyclo-ligase
VNAASVQAEKTTLRRSLLARRDELAPDPEAQTGQLAVLAGVPEIASASVVAAYRAFRGEPDLGPLLADLTLRGVTVLLPVVLPDSDLAFHSSAGDVMPLESADVVLVPALAADRAGHRLGRGGGSYDRVLHRLRPGALAIAVVHADELLARVPVEAHDRSVSAVLAGDEFVRVP